MQVIWNCLYNSHSFCDKGTLKQVTNLIHCFKLFKKVKNNFGAFFSVVLGAHITVAAFKFLPWKNKVTRPRNMPFWVIYPHPVPMTRGSTCQNFMSQFIGQFAGHHTQTLDIKDTSSTDSVFEYTCSTLD